MATNNPIQDINIRKQLLKLEIQRQELEIKQSVKDIGKYFSGPSLKNAAVDYVVQHPQTSIKVGLIAFNLVSGIIQNRRRRRSSRR